MELPWFALFVPPVPAQSVALLRFRRNAIAKELASYQLFFLVKDSRVVLARHLRRPCAAGGDVVEVYNPTRHRQKTLPSKLR